MPQDEPHTPHGPPPPHATGDRVYWRYTTTHDDGTLSTTRILATIERVGHHRSFIRPLAGQQIGRRIDVPNEQLITPEALERGGDASLSGAAQEAGS
jgi:hypothetical protein